MKFLFNHRTKSIVLKDSSIYYDMRSGERIFSPLLEDMTTYLPLKKEFKTKFLQCSEEYLVKLKRIFTTITLPKTEDERTFYIPDLGITYKVKSDNSPLTEEKLIQFSGHIPMYCLNSFVNWLKKC